MFIAFPRSPGLKNPTFSWRPTYFPVLRQRIAVAKALPGIPNIPFLSTSPPFCGTEV